MTSSTESTSRATTPDEPNSDDHGMVRAVARAMDLLAALTAGPSSLTAVSAATRLSKPTAHRLLMTLKAASAVAQDPETGLYQLGPACFTLFDSAYQASATVSTTAGPILAALRDRTGETVTLNVRLGNHRVCINESPSTQPVRYVAGVGDQSPLHLGAGGRVLMAAMTAEGQQAVIDAALASADGKPVDVTRILDDLRTVRRRGFAVSRGERVAGVAALSAPIRVRSSVVASMTIIGPGQRLTNDALRSLRTPLIDAATEIGNRLVFAARATEAG